MPGRSHLFPLERSQSDSSMDNPGDKKGSRKERKTLRKLKQEELKGPIPDDIDEGIKPVTKTRSPLLNLIRKDKKNGEKEKKTVERSDSFTEEGDEKRKSNSLTRMFGRMRKPKNVDVKEDEPIEGTRYGSPTDSLVSDYSSSGYYTPVPQTSDYDTPAQTTDVDQSDEDSGYRKSVTDQLENRTGSHGSCSTLQDILVDMSVTDLPESSQVYLLGPKMTKIADENGKLIEPEEVVLKSEENTVLDKGLIFPISLKTEEVHAENQNVISNIVSDREKETEITEPYLASAELSRGPTDADSDFSNTSTRSVPETSHGLENGEKPTRPTTIDLGVTVAESQLPAQDSAHGPSGAADLTVQPEFTGLPKSLIAIETETLEKELAKSAPVSPLENADTFKSKGSSISSLLESQVSNTDSDSALQEPEPERKPFFQALIGPKPYQKQRPKLEPSNTVTPKDTLPAFSLSENAKLGGLSPPPPSPASSTINLATKEAVKSTAATPEANLRSRRDSIEKLLPTVPILGSPIAKERKAMLDSDSIAKPLMADHQGNKQEHLYKVLVIGELGTGKTSIIKRYVHEFFSQHYRATIGVDFALKVLHWNENTVIRLQLWDIAGQERFNNMTRVYYKEAVGAFIVFDVTRAATFEAVTKWKQDLDSKVQLPDGNPIPCVLLANKCDQQKEGIANSPSKLDEFCKEKGFIGWYETSAKDNVNIDEASKFLVNKILENDSWQENEPNTDPAKVTLDNRSSEKEKKSCC